MGEQVSARQSDEAASTLRAALDLEAFRVILDERLPIAALLGIEAESLSTESATMRACYHPKLLRPGGTIAGPVMMALADATIYGAILARIGPVELAVTTQLSINFLRKPGQGDLLAEARLLKLGKRLAVAECDIRSVGASGAAHDGQTPPAASRGELVAHVTATYSIPPPAERAA